MDEKSSTFGKFIRITREGQGISLRHLAQLCQITHGYLSKIETGSIVPSPENVKTLAANLDVDVDYLFGALGQIDPDLVQFLLKNGTAFQHALRRASEKTVEDQVSFWRDIMKMSNYH